MKPEAIGNIVILGGGTAGWMGAMILARSWPDIQITLLESASVGTIGVGEGSTPALKLFFERCGISEAEWMPECNATYKCGIRFSGWSVKPGFESYFHPFASALDKNILSIYKTRMRQHLQGENVCLHPDQFFLSSFLAENTLAPKPSADFAQDILYGYHFDAGLLGNFLRKKAHALGVISREFHVVAVERAAQGDIKALVSHENQRIDADFFIDCSGFNALLLQKELGSRFIDYRNNLFNNAAVAIASEMDSKIPSQTLATAFKNGWSWKIPLTNRFGNGYVYSADFCSADQAEFELRQQLGLLDSPQASRHLKMRLGRVEEHWKYNCLGVGLAQGFIEPLEATALYLVQQTVEFFVDFFAQGNFTAYYRQDFNRRINHYFDGIRDYVVTHYKTSSRTDTEYWRANTANQADVSATMLDLYRSWLAGEDLPHAIQRLGIGHFYPAPSWYCIFTGMGVLPSNHSPKNPSVHQATLEHVFAAQRAHFPDHRAALAKIRAE